jgi:uncharacterized hydrophobic protein (TIGR00271 family)
MLHIRVVTPRDRTGVLLDALTTLHGISNLVVSDGSGRRPDGDAVQFDVDNKAANPVFRTLRRLGLDRGGGITVQQVDAWIIARGQQDTSAREIAPVWEMVEAAIRGGAVYSPSWYILMVVAGLIGAVGILTNSQILIVGAMVVGPEYSAIVAAALGISQRDRPAVFTSMLALGCGFAAAIVFTFAFGLAVRGAGRAPELFLHGVRPVSGIINSPNAFSVVVAILAGIVGVVSLTQARAGTLIGVFISVTTIPAAADIGISVAFSSWGEAGGSAVQLLLNVVLLVVVGAGGLSTARFIWRRRAIAPPPPSPLSGCRIRLPRQTQPPQGPCPPPARTSPGTFRAHDRAGPR